MVFPPLIKSASKAMLLSRLEFDSNNPRHQALYLQMKVSKDITFAEPDTLTASRKKPSVLSRVS